MLKDVVAQPKGNSSGSVADELTATSEADHDKVLTTSSPAPIQEESKSDDATSIPDEESTEAPPILEIELRTKDGIKRVELRSGDDISELVAKIAQENELSKEVEEAIEYKIRKAVGQQHTLFK